MTDFEPVRGGDSIISQGATKNGNGLFKERDLLMYKTTIKAAIPGMGLFFLFWFLIWVFHATFEVIVVIAIVGGVLYDGILTATKKQAAEPYRLLTRSAFLFAYLWFIYVLNYFLGGYGLLGVLAIVLIISGIILYRHWELYMAWVRHIESRFLGGTAEDRRSQNVSEGKSMAYWKCDCGEVQRRVFWTNKCKKCGKEKGDIMNKEEHKIEPTTTDGAVPTPPVQELSAEPEEQALTVEQAMVELLHGLGAVLHNQQVIFDKLNALLVSKSTAQEATVQSMTEPVKNKGGRPKKKK